MGNDNSSYIMHVVNALGNQLTQQEADVYIKNFHDYKIIDTATARLLMAALSDSSLEDVHTSIRPFVRMKIMKNILVQLAL